MGLGTSGLANVANTDPGDASGLGARTYTGGAIGESLGGSGLRWLSQASGSILLEDGGFMLLESGGQILLE